MDEQNPNAGQPAAPVVDPGMGAPTGGDQPMTPPAPTPMGDATPAPEAPVTPPAQGEGEAAPEAPTEPVV